MSVAVPFMSLYNNLVMFDQHAPRNSLETVVPDLATKWDWKDGNRKLVFTLREGVKWHDGKPFTDQELAGGRSNAGLSLWAPVRATSAILRAQQDAGRAERDGPQV